MPPEVRPTSCLKGLGGTVAHFESERDLQEPFGFGAGDEEAAIDLVAFRRFRSVR